jgi:phosphoribosyl 1,2-cyclic phosphate phosphodiesterase
MEMIFLGTGAAEGSPAAYCRCDTCRGVRQRSGVELRTRSCLRIGPHHQIDLGPDSYFQMIRAGTDLYDVEHVLVTHSHADHFSLQALLDKQMSRETNRKPIRLYMSAPARTYIEGHLAGLDMSPGDNPHQGLGHLEIQERVFGSAFRATAAYDGLRIEI